MRRAIWLAAFAIASSAYGGVRVAVHQTNRTLSADGKVRQVQWSRTIEIDGVRFRVIGPNTLTETSTDDGATTVFSNDPHKIQTPLARKSDGGWPITASIENDKAIVGAPHPGPTINGMATQTYTVDCTYDTVTHIIGIPKHMLATEHYVVTVADIHASPAAMRVLLSHGFGEALSRHPEAFRGFPVRIDGHIVQGSPGAGFTADFRLEATSVEPWTWTDTK